MTGLAAIELGIAHLPLLDVGPPELFDVVARAGYRRTGLRMYAAAPGIKFYPVALARGRDAPACGGRGVTIFDAEFIPLSKDLRPESLDGWMEVAAALGASRVNCGAAGDDPDPVVSPNASAGCATSRPATDSRSTSSSCAIGRRSLRSGTRCELVTRAGRPNGKILVDLLHVARSGGTPADLARLPVSLIGHVQLCDAPLASPPYEALPQEARESRLPPGEGELPLVEMMNALPAGVPLSTEAVTLGSLPGLSPLESAKRAYDGAMGVLAGGRQWRNAAGPERMHETRADHGGSAIPWRMDPPAAPVTGAARIFGRNIDRSRWLRSPEPARLRMPSGTKATFDVPKRSHVPRKVAAGSFISAVLTPRALPIRCAAPRST